MIPLLFRFKKHIYAEQELVIQKNFTTDKTPITKIKNDKLKAFSSALIRNIFSRSEFSKELQL